jgi:protein-S-isoprenylcysteine O-methyltransferase Ste14
MQLEMKVIVALWGLLAVVWGTTALYDTKPTVKAQSSGSRIVQTALLGCGFFLLYRTSIGVEWLDKPIILQPGWIPWIGVSIAFLGVAFAIWARTLLGSNWSGTAKLKAGHTLIRGGPYRIVRHPIYTGILVAALGTAVVGDSLHALLAVPFCILSYWLKIRTEESLLINQFGRDYLDYRHRVKALIPYLL